MTRRDVAVVGDGPAGSALAQALVARGVDVVLIGEDRPWDATYTTWVDDLDGVTMLAGADIWLHRFDSVHAHFEQPRTVTRSYGVIDNDRLRSLLRADVTHRVETVRSADECDARLVVDATGWPSGLDDADRRTLDARPDSMSWQTAFGVVLDDAPGGPLGQPTVMDWTDAPDGGDLDVATFAYSFPVTDGWLVEETVLAGPAVDADRLAVRLASRLDEPVDALLVRARRIERVRIPMGAPLPPHATRTGPVRYGAAAGMIHTATGYSIASTLRAADRVATVIESELGHGGFPDRDAITHAVWPRALRRTRRLHDYGLDVLRDMDSSQIRSFFATFFDLPTPQWSAYLRIDTAPRELAGVMAAMFSRADWPLRRRLLEGDPRLLLGVLRP